MLQYGYCFSRNFKDIRSKQSQARIINVIVYQDEEELPYLNNMPVCFHSNTRLPGLDRSLKTRKNYHLFGFQVQKYSKGTGILHRWALSYITIHATYPRWQWPAMSVFCQKTKVPGTVTEGTLFEHMKISQKYDKSRSIFIFIKKVHEYSMIGYRYMYTQWKGIILSMKGSCLLHEGYTVHVPILNEG